MKAILKHITYCFALTMLFAMVGCEQDLTNKIEFTSSELAVSASEVEVILEESYFDNEITFDWTTGSNRGTGSAIYYTLEVDLAQNDFSAPLQKWVDAEKDKLSYKVNYGTLNKLLLDKGVAAGAKQELKVRISATFANTTVEAQQAETEIAVTTYKPVSNQLFIVGNATSAEWDITKAIALAASNTHRGQFIYQGMLKAGNFKFAVDQDACFCQDFYTKNATDDTKIVYNQGGSGDDLQWEITEPAQYKVTVDLLNLTISIDKFDAAPYDKLFIVGDASPSGWDPQNPVAFTQNPENSFQFTLKAELTPGELKISTFKGDWCDGEWLNAATENAELTATNYIVTQGCNGPDNKWVVSEATKGRYKITVDFSAQSIVFEKLTAPEFANLYMVGNATESDWNIASPVAFVQDATDPFVFVYEGALTEGELKISTFQGDWCDGKWLNAAQENADLSTGFIRTTGCDGPDNKWIVGAAETGNYKITVNLFEDTIVFEKKSK